MTAETDAMRLACEGIADDYMTSEAHHPNHVLIPTAKFNAIVDALAASPAVRPSAQGLESGGEVELKPDFLRALPGGTMDDSTFQDVEDALDRAGAPCRADGDKGRWLTLAERVAALSQPGPASEGEGE